MRSTARTRHLSKVVEPTELRSSGTWPVTGDGIDIRQITMQEGRFLEVLTIEGLVVGLISNWKRIGSSFGCHDEAANP